MIHPQPTTVLLLLSETALAELAGNRRPDNAEPVIRASRGSSTVGLLARTARALRRWRRKGGPSGLHPSSGHLCRSAPGRVRLVGYGARVDDAPNRTAPRSRPHDTRRDQDPHSSRHRHAPRKRS